MAPLDSAQHVHGDLCTSAWPHHSCIDGMAPKLAELCSWGCPSLIGWQGHEAVWALVQKAGDMCDPMDGF